MRGTGSFLFLAVPFACAPPVSGPEGRSTAIPAPPSEGEALQAGPGPLFVDVADRVGLFLGHEAGAEFCLLTMGSGSAWGDFDGDHDVDLFVTSLDGPNRLYANQGDLNGDALPDFIDVAASLGISQPDRLSHSAVFIDYDNDGDQDLYVTHNITGNTLWESRLVELGSPGFVDVTDTAGIGDGGRAITSAWGDFDGDGHLDLYLAKHAICQYFFQLEPTDRLFHSNGDGTFEDWTSYLCGGIAPESCFIVNGFAFSAGWLDYDNDGDLDLYLVNDHILGGGKNRHWRNDGPDGAGGWLFTEIGAEAGTDASLNGMGLGVGDMDNDGWLDLSFSNIAESRMLRNLGDGSFEDITLPCGVYAATVDLVGWGTAFFDADNDGWLDLYFVNGPIFGEAVEPNVLLLNDRDATFTDISEGSGLDSSRRGRSASIADFDGDGWVDVFVGNLGQAPELFLNVSAVESPVPRHWLVVTVEGTQSNRDGIGTRLYLRTNAGTQLREISSGPTHGGGDHRAAYFGLGEEDDGKLAIHWPNGAVEDLGVVQADQALHFVEPLHGPRRDAHD